MSDKLELYAVRNKYGEWFHRKGCGEHTWVEEISTARIYAKPGPARAVIKLFVRLYPQSPSPDLIKLVVNEIVVVDETERNAKKKVAETLRAIAAEARIAEALRERAEEELLNARARSANAKQRLESLTKRQ